MRVIEAGSGLFVFMFDPPPGELEGLNALALCEAGEALLLDAGYKENQAEILSYLSGRGQKPVGAVISHYHPDHADGLALLPGIETWGHAAFRETLRLCFKPERHAALAPRHEVSALEKISFHGHGLELIPLSGHTPDSLGVAVDGRVMYASDLLLFTNEGEPVLPSVHARPVALHAEALKRLGDYLDMAFVPGHGAPVTERAARARDLANRLAYLDAIVRDPGVGLEEAQAGCSPRFRGGEWHDENRA